MMTSSPPMTFKRRKKQSFKDDSNYYSTYEEFFAPKKVKNSQPVFYPGKSEMEHTKPGDALWSRHNQKAPHVDATSTAITPLVVLAVLFSVSPKEDVEMKKRIEILLNSIRYKKEALVEYQKSKRKQQESENESKRQRITSLDDLL